MTEATNTTTTNRRPRRSPYAVSAPTVPSELPEREADVLAALAAFDAIEARIKGAWTVIPDSTPEADDLRERTIMHPAIDEQAALYDRMCAPCPSLAVAFARARSFAYAFPDGTECSLPDALVRDLVTLADSTPDAEIIALGARWDWLNATIEPIYHVEPGDPGEDDAMALQVQLFQQMALVEDQLLKLPAQTFAGLRTKAKIVLEAAERHGTMCPLSRSMLRDVMALSPLCPGAAS